MGMSANYLQNIRMQQEVYDSWPPEVRALVGQCGFRQVYLRLAAVPLGLTVEELTASLASGARL